MLRNNIIFSLLLLLSSCGYHFGCGLHNHIVSLSCVEGDECGYMASALVYNLSAQSYFKYSSSEGDLLLQVELLMPEEENIGFLYAPGDSGGRSKVVVANEGRLSLSANVSLLDVSTGCLILGPTILSSSLSYDFEPDLSNVQNHALSLGQMEMNALAKDAAFPPLYQKLSQKIIDYLAHSCYID